VCGALLAKGSIQRLGDQAPRMEPIKGLLANSMSRRRGRSRSRQLKTHFRSKSPAQQWVVTYPAGPAPRGPTCRTADEDLTDAFRPELGRAKAGEDDGEVVRS
jgi:hypothetical protein